jgi:hypothetical protein
MDGYYEWMRNPDIAGAGKTPFYMSAADGGPLLVGGLWSVWTPGESGEPMRTAAIVTTDAVGALARVHDRMPLVLAERDWDRWLDPDSAAPADLLTAVIEARAKATSIQIDPKNMTAEDMKRFQDAQAGLSGSLSRLMVTVEQYPNLKANQNFLDLQDQLEGTENRITTERRKFNEVARDYNTFIRMFPKNIWSGLFNFAKKPYFEAAEGTEKAPEVKF